MNHEKTNPYAEREKEYHRRARDQDYDSPEPFYSDMAWFNGQKKGWDEGFITGQESYFNVDSENDCADRLYQYLARLHDLVGDKFGEYSATFTLISKMKFELEEAPIPPNPSPLFSNSLPSAENDLYGGNGTWIQPFSFADELH